MVKVKICGITNKEDAFWSSSLGADFIGINFCKDSIRKVSVNNAKEIVANIPPYTTAVGVFVNEPVEQLLKTCKKVNLNFVQLHGSEDIEYCKKLKETSPSTKIMKVFRIKPSIELQGVNVQEYSQKLFEEIKSFIPFIDYVLFDTYVETQLGGTGETFCWDVILELKKLFQDDNIQLNFFIAGGLTPENVEEVIEKVEPWGVDVASGVERLPRRKDYDKMKNFIRKVKNL